jgi:uncharacterized protein (DUF2062 family)
MADAEVQRLHRLRRERMARVKRLLRVMPRRRNVHRYPVLRWFAKAARKRLYLWSFRVFRVIPALYAGCILAFLPLFGIQLPLALALAFLLRCNLPILVSLQFITNPFTIAPLYFTAYQVGQVSLQAVGFTVPQLNADQMRQFLDAITDGRFLYNLSYLSTVLGVTATGGLILGSFVATLATAAYKLAAYEGKKSYQRLRELQHRMRETPSDPADAP